MDNPKMAFVLRIWSEGKMGKPDLRGSVQSVRSREIRYFTSLAQITEIVQQLVRDEKGDSDSRST